MTKATLLVVEDDHHLLGGIRDILELDDYRVLIAQNGVQALDVLQTTNGTPPDLIVSDIMMPQMDGIDLLQAVRKHEKWVAIPFIFLTAKGEKADIQRGKKFGVDDYLVKPFDADDLLVAVDSRLRRHKTIREIHSGAIADLKRNILTILNHEFRTPLTLVVAYADMIKTSNPEDMTDDELLLFLRGVNQGADRLRRLIENFILLVELETGDAAKNYAYRKQPIHDLPSVVCVARDSVIGSELVEHTCETVMDDALPTVVGHHEYLNIIVRELIDNAVKFSPAEKPITLRVTHRDEHVIIEVADQGRGIPEHEFENIWRSFYQINREHYEDQGSGTGLALVKALVDLHGGKIQLESKWGEGSTFRVLLPAQPLAAPAV
ncbi:MAG: response regulator [bacterium]|nr:response regulator [bacterium]